MNDPMNESVRIPSNAAALLSAIAEVDGRDFTETGARMFAMSLDEMTLGEAMAAATKWFNRQHGYSRIMPYDINTTHKETNRERLPTWSEYWHRDLSELKPDEWTQWSRTDPAAQYKAWRLLQKTRGRRDEYDGAPRYIAPPPKPKQEPGYHFIGNLHKSKTTGKENK